MASVQPTPLNPTGLTGPYRRGSRRGSRSRSGSLLDLLLQQPLGGLLGGRLEDALVAEEERLEVGQHARRRGAADDFDRAGRGGARNLAPLGTLPVKIASTCASLSVESGFDLLVTTQIAYWAIG